MTIYDVLVGDCATEEAIVKVHKYIDIIPSNDDLVGFEFEVIRNRDKYINPFYHESGLCRFTKKYDYIIIDTPPSLGLMVGNVFAFADGILIPFNPEQFSMRSLVKVTQTIQEFKEQYNNDLEILGVLGTLVDSRTSLHSDVLQSTRKYCLENNIRVFETVIPRTVRHASSIAYENVPATLSKKFKDAGQCYFELWKELEEIGTKKRLVDFGDVANTSTGVETQISTSISTKGDNNTSISNNDSIKLQTNMNNNISVSQILENITSRTSKPRKIQRSIYLSEDISKKFDRYGKSLVKEQRVI